MKKLLSLTLTLLVLACSKSEDGATETGNIVNPAFDVDLMLGTWVYDTVTINGSTTGYGHNTNCQPDYFVFYNEEGKAFEYEEIIHQDSNCSISQTYLTWRVRGSELSLYFGETFLITYEVLALSATEFVVSAENEDGVEFEIRAVPQNP